MSTGVLKTLQSSKCMYQESSTLGCVWKTRLSCALWSPFVFFHSAFLISFFFFLLVRWLWMPLGWLRQICVLCVCVCYCSLFSCTCGCACRLCLLICMPAIVCARDVTAFYLRSRWITVGGALSSPASSSAPQGSWSHTEPAASTHSNWGSSSWFSSHHKYRLPLERHVFLYSCFWYLATV